MAVLKIVPMGCAEDRTYLWAVLQAPAGKATFEKKRQEKKEREIENRTCGLFVLASLRLFRSLFPRRRWANNTLSAPCALPAPTSGEGIFCWSNGRHTGDP